jgi:peptidoglycan hydrolase CwlO-like protein
MSKMYKLDPFSPKPEPAILTEDDKKIVSLESKVNRLTEQVTRLQSDLTQLSKTVRRQNSDINNILSRINRLK